MAVTEAGEKTKHVILRLNLRNGSSDGGPVKYPYHASATKLQRREVQKTTMGNNSVRDSALKNSLVYDHLHMFNTCNYL